MYFTSSCMLYVLCSCNKVHAIRFGHQIQMTFVVLSVLLFLTVLLLLLVLINPANIFWNGARSIPLGTYFLTPGFSIAELADDLSGQTILITVSYPKKRGERRKRTSLSFIFLLPNPCIIIGFK